MPKAVMRHRQVGGGLARELTEPLKVFDAGEWLHEKHGGKPRRSWRRLHLAIDPDSSEILAAELTDEGDASLVGPLLDQIDGPISAVLADGA